MERNPASRLVFEQLYVKSGVSGLILSFRKKRQAWFYSASRTQQRDEFFIAVTGCPVHPVCLDSFQTATSHGMEFELSVFEC